MELTFEAYRIVLKYVEGRADMAALCRVSRRFRRVAERALYDTLFMRNDDATVSLCKTLATSSRLAMHVDALTIYSSDDDDADDDSSDDDDNSENTQDESSPPSRMDWAAVAGALQRTTRLRYLNVHISSSSITSTGWVLEGCTFQLHKFHCDFAWDHQLAEFLNTQMDLEDLYLLDYRHHRDSESAIRLAAPYAFHKLSMLECTFSEAAVALVPGRPITHLKTCFSRTESTAKREEMGELLLKVALSTRALRSVDVADASYTETFSLEFLSAIVNMGSAVTDLRHLGTLVLPVEGRKRLQFYGHLRHLSNIQSLELVVSQWEPPPSTPAALKALASEVRLYKPSVVQIIFVQDFERTVITAVDGICRVNSEVNMDTLWRDI
ncbi:hypothetical protein M413DRAFT_288553 [Hebeloma cylindrosporum]|uniref:F-box domain-containing protein n=1 Tax=Hebeloma cylindrosporum TaxID=76867 RepID=A0A0C2Y668_HEBCY|nr:hypothetical protein M413DRAFT_288553 [Hebeloma cylindrosporum h7]